MKTPINKVVRILVSIDFATNFAFGSFAPIFAIFLTSQISGGNAQAAGFAMAAYWLTKSVFQLPIAKFLDKTDGEKDDFYALVFGNLMGSIVIFLYGFATTTTHIYIIQAMLGLSMAIAVPAWYGIFSRHIDKGRTSFEWSLESVFSIGVATAFSGAIGGTIATYFGFDILFIGAGVIALFATFSMIFLQPYLIPKKDIKPVVPLIDEKGRQRDNI